MSFHDQVQGLIYTLEACRELNVGHTDEGHPMAVMKDQTTIDSDAWLRFLNLLKKLKGHLAN